MSTTVIRAIWVILLLVTSGCGVTCNMSATAHAQQDTVKIRTAGGVLSLPLCEIYDYSIWPDRYPLRMNGPSGVGGLPLVLPDNDQASPLRICTTEGNRAVSKLTFETMEVTFAELGGVFADYNGTHVLSWELHLGYWSWWDYVDDDTFISLYPATWIEAWPAHWELALTHDTGVGLDFGFDGDLYCPEGSYTQLYCTDGDATSCSASAGATCEVTIHVP